MFGALNEVSSSVVMITGPRVVPSPLLLENVLSGVLAGLQYSFPDLVVLSGGAVGVDTIFARVAFRAGVPFDVELPHEGYAAHYGIVQVTDALCAYARNVTFTSSSSSCSVGANFARNASMVRRADIHVVVHELNPVLISKDISGGTAACVRDMRRILPVSSPVLWVPADGRSVPQVVFLNKE